MNATAENSCLAFAFWRMPWIKVMKLNAIVWNWNIQLNSRPYFFVHLKHLQVYTGQWTVDTNNSKVFIFPLDKHPMLRLNIWHLVSEFNHQSKNTKFVILWKMRPSQSPRLVFPYFDCCPCYLPFNLAANCSCFLKIAIASNHDSPWKLIAGVRALLSIGLPFNMLLSRRDSGNCKTKTIKQTIVNEQGQNSNKNCFWPLGRIENNIKYPHFSLHSHFSSFFGWPWPIAMFILFSWLCSLRIAATTATSLCLCFCRWQIVDFLKRHFICTKSFVCCLSVDWSECNECRLFWFRSTK